MATAPERGNREGENERMGGIAKQKQERIVQKIQKYTSALVLLPTRNTNRTSSLPLHCSIANRCHTVVTDARSR